MLPIKVRTVSLRRSLNQSYLGPIAQRRAQSMYANSVVGIYGQPFRWFQPYRIDLIQVDPLCHLSLISIVFFCGIGAFGQKLYRRFISKQQFFSFSIWPPRYRRLAFMIDWHFDACLENLFN